MEYNSSRKNPNLYEKDIEQFQQQQNEELLTSMFNNLYRSLTPNCPSGYTLPVNFQNLLKRILFLLLLFSVFEFFYLEFALLFLFYILLMIYS